MLITANIATTGRRPEQLKRTIKSLKNQVDLIRVYDNSKNIDLTDNAKFWGLSHTLEDEYYFTCDDDLIYPSDYVQHTIKAIKKFKTIITYHGRILKDLDLYYKADHTQFRFNQSADKFFLLNVAGTGCTAFDTRYFKPIIHDSKYKRMSDLVFSLEAKKQNKLIILPPHKGNWIKEQSVEDSIYQSEVKGTQENQVKLMKLIYG